MTEGWLLTHPTSSQPAATQEQSSTESRETSIKSQTQLQQLVTYPIPKAAGSSLILKSLILHH
jgi:hypothetical protein